MVSLLVFSSVMRLMQVKCCSVILVENDFHSNVLIGLMAKAYPALVGTFSLQDEILSLCWNDLLQRIAWQ